MFVHIFFQFDEGWHMRISPLPINCMLSKYGPMLTCQ